MKKRFQEIKHIVCETDFIVSEVNADMDKKFPFQDQFRGRLTAQLNKVQDHVTSGNVFLKLSEQKH